MPSTTTSSVSQEDPHPTNENYKTISGRTRAGPGLLPVKGAPMLTAPTLEKLHALKLTAMAAAWTEQQHQADMTALAFDEPFRLLTEAEWLAPENKRLARAPQETKLKLSQACIEAIDYPARRELAQAAIRPLPTGRCH